MLFRYTSVSYFARVYLLVTSGSARLHELLRWRCYSSRKWLPAVPKSGYTVTKEQIWKPLKLSRAVWSTDSPRISPLTLLSLIRHLQYGAVTKLSKRRFFVIHTIYQRHLRNTTNSIIFVLAEFIILWVCDSADPFLYFSQWKIRLQGLSSVPREHALQPLLTVPYFSPSDRLEKTMSTPHIITYPLVWSSLLRTFFNISCRKVF